jgi:hypothetical protein
MKLIMTGFLKYKLQIEIFWKFCGLPNKDVQIARDFPKTLLGQCKIVTLSLVMQICI